MTVVLFWALMLGACIWDYRYRIIPDAITLPGIGLAIMLTPSLPVSIAGVLVAGCLMAFVADFLDAGGGDVKLVAMIGAFLGIISTLASLGLALAFMIAAFQISHKKSLPFAPFLTLGVICANL